MFCCGRRSKKTTPSISLNDETRNLIDHHTIPVDSAFVYHPSPDSISKWVRNSSTGPERTVSGFPPRKCQKWLNKPVGSSSHRSSLRTNDFDGCSKMVDLNEEAPFDFHTNHHTQQEPASSSRSSSSSRSRDGREISRDRSLRAPRMGLTLARPGPFQSRRLSTGSTGLEVHLLDSFRTAAARRGVESKEVCLSVCSRKRLR